MSEDVPDERSEVPAEDDWPPRTVGEETPVAPSVAVGTAPAPAFVPPWSGGRRARSAVEPVEAGSSSYGAVSDELARGEDDAPGWPAPVATELRGGEAAPDQPEAAAMTSVDWLGPIVGGELAEMTVSVDWPEPIAFAELAEPTVEVDWPEPTADAGPAETTAPADWAEPIADAELIEPTAGGDWPEPIADAGAAGPIATTPSAEPRPADETGDPLPPVDVELLTAEPAETFAVAGGPVAGDAGAAGIVPASDSSAPEEEGAGDDDLVLAGVTLALGGAPPIPSWPGDDPAGAEPSAAGASPPEDGDAEDLALSAIVLGLESEPPIPGDLLPDPVDPKDDWPAPVRPAADEGTDDMPVGPERADVPERAAAMVAADKPTPGAPHAPGEADSDTRALREMWAVAEDDKSNDDRPPLVRRVVAPLAGRWSAMRRGERLNVVLYALTGVSILAMTLELLAGPDALPTDVTTSPSEAAAQTVPAVRPTTTVTFALPQDTEPAPAPEVPGAPVVTRAPTRAPTRVTSPPAAADEEPTPAATGQTPDPAPPSTAAPTPTTRPPVVTTPTVPPTTAAPFPNTFPTPVPPVPPTFPGGTVPGISGPSNPSP